MAVKVFYCVLIVFVMGHSVRRGYACKTATSSIGTAGSGTHLGRGDQHRVNVVIPIMDASQANNLTDVMVFCNETFATQMDYLIELNMTGSFPDETDRTPMCFVRCYLENVGIINRNDTVDREQAISMLWPNSGDAIDDCIMGMDAKDGDTCEKGYYLTRCVVTRALVDGPSKDNRK